MAHVLDLIFISEILSSTVWSRAPRGAHRWFADQLTVLSWAWGLCMYAGPFPYRCLFLFYRFFHRYTPCGEFFLCELNVNPRGFSSYWRVFLTSQLDFLHILLTSSSFLSLVMGRSLFPLKPVSFSISPMQNSQASVVLFVVFKPVFEVFSSCRVIGGTNVLCTRDSENNWSYFQPRIKNFAKRRSF